MLRNCIAAALRHLGRNRLYAAIGVIGLGVGLAAALLAALVVRNQYTYDHFIPGHGRIYMVVTAVTPPGHPTLYKDSASVWVGHSLASRFTEIQAVTRGMLFPMTVRRGSIESSEPVYTADPNFFDVLRLPVYAGELAGALSSPGKVVLSRSLARKYFGRDTPLGQTLEVRWNGATHPLAVSAVIEDLPVNATYLKAAMFVSSAAPWTPLHAIDAIPGEKEGQMVEFGAETYLEFAPAASPSRVLAAMPAMAQILFQRPPQDWKVALALVRMDRMNSFPAFNPGFHSRIAMIASVGAAVLAIAIINFVNLLTARIGHRALEAGVRRLSGAGSTVVFAQFLLEPVAYVLVAALVAVGLAEWMLPRVNAFLSTGATFDYWHDPELLASMACGALLLGILVGLSPAWSLSRRRAVGLITMRAPSRPFAGYARRLLVALQFAILIGLTIVVGVVYLQREFAVLDALGIDTDQLLLVRSGCLSAFVNQVRSLPGVRGVGCSDRGLLADPAFMVSPDRTRTQQLLYIVPVTPGLLELYGIRPVAGSYAQTVDGYQYVINETAARRLGFSRPSEAVGFRIYAHGYGGSSDDKAMFPVIAVVPDFRLGSVQNRIEAFAYLFMGSNPNFGLNRRFELVSIRLSGSSLPETLAGIDGAWSRNGDGHPIDRFFLNDYIQRLYLALEREAQLFAALAVIAVVIGCLGLVGLAVSITERRRKEVAVRKALGAETHQILRLLLRQLCQPVVLANLLAWPVAGWAMHRWLAGFAYHIGLPLWLFVAAAAGALLIALLTVSTHAALTARARPAGALRYE